MTDKEVRRLNRRELLELYLAERRENEELRSQLEQAKRRLASRRIRISKAGSIAEAALDLNDVFEAAEKAAAQYLENIRYLAEEEAE